MNKRHRSSCSSGFTLIELLVVISIIGLLSAVIGVQISQVRVQARDGKRMAEAAQIKKAFLAYTIENKGQILSTGSVWKCLGRGDGTLCHGSPGVGSTFTGMSSVDAAIAPYISSIPFDTLSGAEVVSGRYGDSYMYRANYTGGGIVNEPVLHWGLESCNATADSCMGGNLGQWPAGQGLSSCRLYCIMPIYR